MRGLYPRRQTPHPSAMLRIASTPERASLASTPTRGEGKKKTALELHSFEARQRSHPRAVRRVRTECRAGCRHLAGAALAAEAWRVPPDAVAAGQAAARRSARRVVSGRVVSIL